MFNADAVNPKDRIFSTTAATFQLMDDSFMVVTCELPAHGSEFPRQLQNFQLMVPHPRHLVFSLWFRRPSNYGWITHSLKKAIRQPMRFKSKCIRVCVRACTALCVFMCVCVCLRVVCVCAANHVNSKSKLSPAGWLCMHETMHGYSHNACTL